ncbi:hypothetical protein GCM10012287_42290 [Streptomyces daqingensis]|uniref:Helix-turn-helix domain-containing protein n=1 Tax=Streptomyces daqingensis TaxID=1472640 RepID=A0ABQ2MPX0_9ACTN|nr:hypothetical protein [Streptomyces daqingensis]GGO54110.1 hypothetical protein GCM10012287_42290 [Streptomyces daqingensis]
MDTAKLELAAQRCREAEEALEAARSDLRTEAAVALRGADRDGQAAVSRITGWSRAYLRKLMRADKAG